MQFVVLGSSNVNSVWTTFKEGIAAVKRFNLKCCNPIQIKSQLTAQLSWRSVLKFAGNKMCSLGQSDFVESLYLVSIWKKNTYYETQWELSLY
jgi:hypothetical protein